MMIIVFTTTPNNEEAESLAQKIIEAKLGACVQILPPIKSFYFWDNEIRADFEFILLIKTLAEKFDELENFIRTNHSYDVPEIISIKTDNVSDNYFKWLKSYINANQGLKFDT